MKFERNLCLKKVGHVNFTIFAHFFDLLTNVSPQLPGYLYLHLLPPPNNNDIDALCLFFH